MEAAINNALKEQFGVGAISEKTWLVMTEDVRNLARTPVKNGRFHPAIMLEEIQGDTAADALGTFLNCFRQQRWFAVVGTVEDALKKMSGPMVKWNGEIVRPVPDSWFN